ncbi:hypothetical protein RQ094_003828 [Salmonella enterica]|uniref:LuxR C-terminal-related transcriptional regulator n=1 Tax=Citrobacter sp. wls710 TaxID=2576426 RepID=UPI0010C98028|nr:LuxR C-terminal-related transcriptional regulator [Citrobacter sp. wls710]EBK0028740.1 hypothetical protein [Salmonella enterica]EDN6746546.1 hypothetical protein [Salmonella enterica]ELI0025929.1 hypothetical protein [Salmonella enterica]ELI0151726.1 hypothetical protein [Salmonella enterica]TKU69076.1 hypothetical protein FDX14_23060 [Citrobacter sp. wls710]
MDIYTSNFFLKSSLQHLLSDISPIDKLCFTAIVDFNSTIDSINLYLGMYKKIIVLINEDSDILLFNNVIFHGQVYYINMNLNFGEFMMSLFTAIGDEMISLKHPYSMNLKKKRLSKRQMGVLKLTAKGYNLTEISEILNISVKLSSGYLISALKRINKKMNLVTFNKIKYLLLN